MYFQKLNLLLPNIVKRKDVQRVIFLTKSATQQHVWLHLERVSCFYEEFTKGKYSVPEEVAQKSYEW